MQIINLGRETLHKKEHEIECSDRQMRRKNERKAEPFNFRTTE